MISGKSFANNHKRMKTYRLEPLFDTHRATSTYQTHALCSTSQWILTS